MTIKRGMPVWPQPPPTAWRRLKAATFVRVWHCAEHHLRRLPGNLSTDMSAQRASQTRLHSSDGPVWRVLDPA